jgi:hypothetical protein
MLATMLPLVAARFLANRPTLGTRTLTLQFGVVKEAHSVNTPYTVEGNFKIREAGTIGAGDMLTRVLQRMAESANEPTTLTLKKVRWGAIDSLLPYPNNLRAVFFGADLSP